MTVSLIVMQHDLSKLFSNSLRTPLVMSSLMNSDDRIFSAGQEEKDDLRLISIDIPPQSFDLSQKSFLLAHDRSFNALLMNSMKVPRSR